MREFGRYILVGLLISVPLAQVSYASEVGTVTLTDGKVQLLSHPSRASGNLKGPGPHVKFEGVYYSVKTVQIGDRFQKGNLIRTAPGGKARIVYDNGDQFNLGSGTAFRVSSSKSDRVTLDYGSVRSVISKKGPRKRLRIRTKSATMGVRGTDFFISHRRSVGGTQVSVLRGKVELKSNLKKKTPKIEVARGEKAKVWVENKTPRVDQARINKRELLEIQKVSTIKRRIPEKLKNSLKVKVRNLENKAKEMTLDDIKESDPEVFKQVSRRPSSVASVNAINTQVVQSLFKDAPDPKDLKPGEGELRDLERDAYDKYFKINE